MNPELKALAELQARTFDLNPNEHLRIYSRGIGTAEKTRRFWICRQAKSNPVGSQTYFTTTGGWHVPYGRAAHKFTREFRTPSAALKTIETLIGGQP